MKNIFSYCVQPHNVAAAIHDYRMSRGMSLYDLQKQTNIHRIILYAFEHNRIEPSASDLYIICKSFDISIDQLFFCAKEINQPVLYDKNLNDYLIKAHETPEFEDSLYSREQHLIYEFLAPVLYDPDRKQSIKVKE